MKKLAKAVSFTCLILLSNHAYSDDDINKRKISHLLEDEKYIIWDTENILKADVAWDDKADYILGGRTEIEYVLAIVNGANTKKYHIMKFDNVYSFCDVTKVKIIIYNNSGYKISKSTRKKSSIVLDDDLCDPNVIDWSKKNKTFEVFRN